MKKIFELLLSFFVFFSRKEYNRDKSPKNLSDLSQSEIYLHLISNRETSWDNYRDLLENLRINRRINLTRTVINSLWAQGKFDDARLATEFWCELTQEQMISLGDGAQKALDILRTTSFWYLGRSGGTLTGREALSALTEADKIGGQIVKRYRDSRLMLAVFRWSKAHNDVQAAQSLPTISRNFGSFYPSFTVNAQFAKSIGMSVRKFDKLREEAEKIVDSPI